MEGAGAEVPGGSNVKFLTLPEFAVQPPAHAHSPTACSLGTHMAAQLRALPCGRGAAGDERGRGGGRRKFGWRREWRNFRREGFFNDQALSDPPTLLHFQTTPAPTTEPANPPSNAPTSRNRPIATARAAGVVVVVVVVES